MAVVQQGSGVVTERLVERASTALEGRTSRRGLLARAALVGSALSVGPLRYLLHPTTAWAVIGPGSCSRGLCTDGYTAFCCEINHGKNTCPPHTYTAGWWKCTAYRGKGLCSKENVRYYVDCNRKPGQHFPGGCHCAGNDCGKRRVDCNHFRYGQCNTQVGGTTEVACRVVTCQHPATISRFNCNRTLKIDNAVCGHEAGCLKQPAVQQLPGGGGV
jgi:hypothetical protein